MFYADFDYYTNTFYGDTIPEERFHRYAAKASREIDRLTMGRASEAGGVMAARLSTCCCEIAEILYKADEADAKTAGGIIAAQSNDGLSTTFAAGAAVSGAGIAGRIITTAVCWLSAPQNLMYQGV